MLDGNEQVKVNARARKRGSTRKELGQQLKGVISDIPFDRVKDRERINGELRRITSIQVMDRAIERIEREKKENRIVSIEEIIEEMEIECNRILESI